MAARGFSLIELMVVTAIVTVMAALAIPAFTKFTCRGRQTEAKTNLTAIIRSIEAFRREHDADGVMHGGIINGCTHVDTDFIGRNDLGFGVKGRSRYQYMYFFVDSYFFVQATGCNSSMLFDQWSQSSDTEFRALTNVCR